MKKTNKMISIIILAITLIMQCSNIFAVTEISKADITYVKDCGDHLQATDNDGNTWYTIMASYVEYEAPNGKKYPAYCLDNTKPGVGNDNIGDIPEGYSVNITKILDNDKVYTAIINGYPYKTPDELGVEDKYDAFMATKQAVYSVLYNFDVDEHYKGVDERGKNIKKAIKKIVNEARNHTKSPSTALITFKKEGKFVEDANKNNYYSQTYSVSSDIDMKQYTIISTAKLPDGSYVSDVNGNKQTTFSANEKFKVMIPKDKANALEKVEGVISVQAKCRNYPVFYR